MQKDLFDFNLIEEIKKVEIQLSKMDPNFAKEAKYAIKEFAKLLPELKDCLFSVMYILAILRDMAVLNRYIDMFGYEFYKRFLVEIDKKTKSEMTEYKQKIFKKSENLLNLIRSSSKLQSRKISKNKPKTPCKIIKFPPRDTAKQT